MKVRTLIVNSLKRNYIELDIGIQKITDALYENSFSIFGESKQTTKNTSKRKRHYNVHGLIKTVWTLEKSLNMQVVVRTGQIRI
jgi:hypothetical protein